MGLEEMGWDYENRIDVAQDREKLWAVVNKITNLWIQ
jgi:hypothetical protein